MAVSRLSSATPDTSDVTTLIEAFQELNSCEITLFGRVENVRGKSQLTLLIGALVATPDSPDPQYLGSVKCYLGTESPKTIEGAIIWGLYRLDWELEKMRVTGEG